MEPSPLQSTVGDDAGSKHSRSYLCWVALETIDGRRFLDRIRVPDNTEQAMRALVAWHASKLATTQPIAQTALCQRVFVGTGRLELWSCRLGFLAAGSQETQFASIKRDKFLTAGFRRPASLAEEPYYIWPVLYPENLSGSNDMGAHEQNIIFVGYETDKQRLAQCFVMCAFLSLIAGICVGIATRKIVNGAAVGGTVLAFVSAVQAACFFACAN